MKAITYVDFTDIALFTDDSRVKLTKQLNDIVSRSRDKDIGEAGGAEPLQKWQTYTLIAITV